MIDLRRRLAAPAILPQLALAALVANIGIVVTGGAVRLTRSGLGCPTWPRCTPQSYVNTPAMGVHGMIEFGNRTLTFVVGLLAVGCVVAAVLRRPARRELTVLSIAAFAGIPAQAVVGGFAVRTGLNPWVVALHFLVSMAVIALGYLLRVRSGEPAGTAPDRPDAGPDRVAASLRGLAWLVVAVCGAVLAIGTVVTGSGPHAGDADAPRTGLDPGQVAQLHADLVFGLLGLSVALWIALRAAGAGRAARRAAGVLVAVELAQGVVGFVQYFTNLPVVAVGLHMLGACLVWVAALAVLVRTGSRAGGGRGVRTDAGRAGPAAAGDTVAGDTAGDEPAPGQPARSTVPVAG